MYVSERNLGVYLSTQMAQGDATCAEAHGRVTRSTNRRQERRFPVNEMAFVQSLYPSRSKKTRVKIHDISRTGLGISSPEDLVPGTLVQVLLIGVCVIGQVRHCSKRDNLFRVGVFVETCFHRMQAVAAE